jgi:hypothetical protein
LKLAGGSILNANKNLGRGTKEYPAYEQAQKYAAAQQYKEKITKNVGKFRNAQLLMKHIS